MPIAALLPILVSVLGQAPAVIEDVKSIWALATQTTAPTLEQQTQFDSALETAHNALQAM